MKYILIYWGRIHQIVELFADTGTQAEDLLNWMGGINDFTRRNNMQISYYLIQRHD